METSLTIKQPVSGSKISIWVGRGLTILVVLFLAFDAIFKMINHGSVITASAQLGIPGHIIQPIGIVLLVSTIIYVIPRTAIVGAILLTGYLGGAIFTMARANQPVYFSLIFGLLVWAALLLRDKRVGMIFSLLK
jgi:hypothetical protein